MKNIVSRRDVLGNVLAGSAAATAVFAVSSTPALAKCRQNHQKMAYRLGALVVSPITGTTTKAQLLAAAKCPSCGVAIEPDGMSYGEHMQK